MSILELPSHMSRHDQHPLRKYPCSKVHTSVPIAQTARIPDSLLGKVASSSLQTVMRRCGVIQTLPSGEAKQLHGSINFILRAEVAGEI